MYEKNQKLIQIKWPLLMMIGLLSIPQNLPLAQLWFVMNVKISKTAISVKWTIFSII